MVTLKSGVVLSVRRKIVWARLTKIPVGVETNIVETKNPMPGETKNRKRGRPRRETKTPWTIAGISRATWYRRQVSVARLIVCLVACVGPPTAAGRRPAPLSVYSTAGAIC